MAEFFYSRASILLGLLLAVACEPSYPKKEGADAVKKFECNRCHTAELLPKPKKDDCVSCHAAIIDGTADYPEQTLKRFQQTEFGYPAAPSLSAASRFRRSWFVEFIQNPHDLRPNLSGEMPHLSMTPQEADKIADYFEVFDTTDPSSIVEDEIESGKILFENKGCASCHRVGGLELEPKAIPVEVDSMIVANQLAPDLAHTRQRMTSKRVEEWIRDPKSVKPDTTMPQYVLSKSEVNSLTAFVFGAALPAKKPAEVPTRLPILEREVKYSEVLSKVFRKVCWHCHSEPMWLEGIDGGPGNVGGFGYPGKQINFSSYERIREGGIDRDGSVIDLLESKNGTSKIVKHMMARHHEVAGNPMPGVLGMPLGFAPISIENIQLVETWIAQGAKR